MNYAARPYYNYCDEPSVVQLCSKALPKDAVTYRRLVWLQVVSHVSTYIIKIKKKYNIRVLASRANTLFNLTRDIIQQQYCDWVRVNLLCVPCLKVLQVPAIVQNPTTNEILEAIWNIFKRSFPAYTDDITSIPLIFACIIYRDTFITQV